MKIVKEGTPTEPYRRVPPPHDCQTELWREERRVDFYHRFGMILRCDCGLSHELRPGGGWDWLFGIGSGNMESRYGMTQYWHGLGWSEVGAGL
jgi:hypothetical protein